MGIPFVQFSVASFAFLPVPSGVEKLRNVLPVFFFFFPYRELREQVLPELKELVKQQVRFFDIWL